MRSVSVLLLLLSALVSIHGKKCDVDAHGVCLVVSDDSAPWEEARAHCTKTGGHLAILEKTPLREAMDQLSNINVPLWIGIHELVVETHPYWVNGEKLGRHCQSCEFPWNEDDKNSEKNDCVLAVPDAASGGFLWQYAPCDDSNHYLCSISDLDKNAKKKLQKEQDEIEAARKAELESTFAIIESQNQNIDSGENILVEGDIMLTPEQKEMMERGPVGKRGVIWIASYFWPDAKVYYSLADVFDDDQEQMIADAMEAIENATCVVFIERTTETDYINITKEDGCWSYLGRQSGVQKLSLADGCFYAIGVPIHELLHALGFFHEHSRPDRDDFVVINEDNIIPTKLNNFRKYDPINTQGVYYDYGSLMHYGQFAFALDQTIPTITLKQATNAIVGQRNGLSHLDSDEINRIYNCKVPVDGNWSPWSTWSPCPVTCGGSTQTRTRKCNFPPPSTDPAGQPCVGVDFQVRTCMDIPCPVNLNYTWLGCYWDDGDGELLTSLENTGNPYLIGQYFERDDPVGQCAAAAAHVLDDIFALRFGGKCYSMSTEEDGTLYQEGGASEQCYDGTGTADSIDVYAVDVPESVWGPWSPWSDCVALDPSHCLGNKTRGQRTRNRDCVSISICEGEEIQVEFCVVDCESPDEWRCIGDDLFVFVQQTVLSWGDARVHCQNMDSFFAGDLAVVTDKAIGTDIRDSLLSTASLSFPPGSGYWVGCSDIAVEGSFVWLNGQPVDLATGWAGNNPNNNPKRCPSTGQDCCQLWQKRSFLMDDDCCERGKAFICKIIDFCREVVLLAT